MDVEKLIEQLNEYSAKHQQHGGITAQAADALSMLQAENEKLRAELEQVKNERDSTRATLSWLNLHGLEKEG